MPVMMPAAAMASSYMPYAASCENSRNGEPGSSSARTRSRGSSLPRATCFARAASPPPCSIDGDLRAEVGDQRRHRLAVARERRVARVEPGFDDGHGGSGIGRRSCLGARRRCCEHSKPRQRRRHGVRLRQRMAGHQRVGMHPAAARRGSASSQAAMRRIGRPVDADLLGPEQVAAERQVGDRQPVADDVRRPARCASSTPHAVSARARRNRRAPPGRRRRRERAQEAQRRRVARELVVVPEQPAQDLAPLVVVARAEAARASRRGSRGSRPTATTRRPRCSSTGTSPITFSARYAGVRVSPPKKSTKRGAQSAPASASSSAGL